MSQSTFRWFYLIIIKRCLSQSRFEFLMSLFWESIKWRFFIRTPIFSLIPFLIGLKMRGSSNWNVVGQFLGSHFSEQWSMPGRLSLIVAYNSLHVIFYASKDFLILLKFTNTRLLIKQFVKWRAVKWTNYWSISRERYIRPKFIAIWAANIMFYLEKNRLGFHWLHVDVVTVNLDSISGQGGPDPHGLGLLEEADHHLEQDLRITAMLQVSHLAWV